MIKHKILFIFIFILTTINAQFIVTGESQLTGKLLKKAQKGKKVDIPQKVFIEASNKAYEEAIFKELYNM